MWRLGLLAFLLALPASAQTDNDTVRSASKPRFQVVDGDTVRFGSQLVRLFGIDAPEKAQTCDDGRWHPGPLAKKERGILVLLRLEKRSANTKVP